MHPGALSFRWYKDKLGGDRNGAGHGDSLALLVKGRKSESESLQVEFLARDLCKGGRAKMG